MAIYVFNCWRGLWCLCWEGLPTRCRGNIAFEQPQIRIGFSVNIGWIVHAEVGILIEFELSPHLRFWNYLVQFYPLWLAPNLITLIGLVVNFITVLILSHYCYTATEEVGLWFRQLWLTLVKAPRWVYVQAALGLFIYQTLDATDGKQARRTGSSSPLGELFDHGCDSMTQVLVTLNLCYAMQLGLHVNFVFTTVVISVAMFYAAHWSTYCTGYLKFSRFDVTEAQMIVISILLLTAAFGPGIWSISVGQFDSLTNPLVSFRSLEWIWSSCWLSAVCWAPSIRHLAI